MQRSLYICCGDDGDSGGGADGCGGGGGHDSDDNNDVNDVNDGGVSCLPWPPIYGSSRVGDRG